MTSPYQTGPNQRGWALSHGFLPIALIALGVMFLLGNLVPERGRGGLVMLGLGVAFLIGRLTTGRYGYAVPAGILLGLAAYVGLQGVQGSPSGSPTMESGGWFFASLGLGFGLVYLIGLRPEAVWPLFPATVLLGLGLVSFGIAALAPLAGLSWIVSYWPVALVFLGLWLLFRERLPEPLQRPVATLGGLALLAYGIVAAVASVAAGGELVRTGWATNMGAPSAAETVRLDAPILTGQTFNVNNQNGKTTIRATGEPNVIVVATKHTSFGGQTPDVRLTPREGGLTLDASSSGRRWPFGGSSRVDLAIEVPEEVAVHARSSSGAIEIAGVKSAVLVESSSGQLNLADLAGPVQARSSSGPVALSNVAGEVRVSTSSGSVRGTELRRVREASTSSGSVTLEGIFTEQARISTSSGAVSVKLLPGSAVNLDVRTAHGKIDSKGPQISGTNLQRNSLTGVLGTPSAGVALSIETSGGSVVLSQ